MEYPAKPVPIIHDVAAEHAKMPKLLNRLHALIESRAGTPSTVGEAIDSVVVFLRDHFTREDEGGFFDEIAARAPRLLNRAREVSQEHVEILAGMEAFRDVALMGDASESWWNTLNLTLQRLMRELMQHEHRERELLQDAFMDDIGTGD